MKVISQEGLYDPRYEHDACGVGFVVNIDGRVNHSIVRQGIQVLENLVHRGACGCDPDTGDGAGMLLQLPHRFFAEEAERLGFELPESGSYATAMVFLPTKAEDRKECMGLLEKATAEEGQTFLGWREVPRDSSAIGWLARENEPVIMQAFIKREQGLDVEGFERKLYVIRRSVENSVRLSSMETKTQFYVPSMSARTIVYKGLMLAQQMGRYYPDLSQDNFESSLALVHQRYSTNTLPTWPLAHPFRFLAHNGEINTLRGNINMMASREKHLTSTLFGGNIKKLLPVLTEGASDSAIFDNAFEMLVRGGRSVAHSMMMMVPEPWSGYESMPDEKRAFYEYNACLMEPWDGPASMAFTDGVRIGAVLDRNGLRPSRYWVTDDNFVVMASEVGVLDIPQEKIIHKGRLEPGRMFLIDTEEKRIISDDEIKEGCSMMRPYRQWITRSRVTLPKDCPTAERAKEKATITERQQVFGYTQEDLDIVLLPMLEEAHEAVGSMGNDSPLAVLSSRPLLLFNYFKQLFAQVTNPPIDSIREEIVMSLETTIGREGNLLEETPIQCRQLHLKSPIITDAQLRFIKEIDKPGLKSAVISTLFPADEGPEGMERAVERICSEASDAIASGASILVLSDRGVDADNAAIPCLLACGAVHHHLVREQTRTQCGIVIESGEPREVMHFAMLTGFGAGAVNPYLAFDTIYDMILKGLLKINDPVKAIENYIKSIEKGLLKVMSKIGISTQQSYRGAQIFEAIGLGQSLIDRCFTGTVSRISGIDILDVGRETLMRHALAFSDQMRHRLQLDPGGQYRWRHRGEFHQYNPETVALLQHATRTGNRAKFHEYSSIINDRTRTLATLRGLLKFKKGASIPLDEVEPASEIVKRFCTGAMSFGSISKEAHETLAIAMNRLGGRSNTGEGGEDPLRFERDANGDLRRSAIKQIASGRFGVTNEYLVNADELQIKMAQGAKPGEGGQLPGHKVFAEIAKVRYSTPGVELISPPPHHDIYSIEDLAQLIHDLKNSNVHAKVSVKLVSEVGVGTIAAGVAKGKADLVLISGHDGGTGASPLTSVKHAGLPWELGLAETHQVLVENNLRSRIRVQVDGQLKTGRDVTIGALLGADEFGFATSALVTLGCTLMRKCHLNTCPVGIATQDPELRKKFKGKPEYVVNMLTMIAEEVRGIMAELGFRTMNEMIGRADMLEFNPLPEHWKAKKLDFSKILYLAKPWKGETLYCSKTQDHGIDKALDLEIMKKVKPTIEHKAPLRVEIEIRNTNRTVGTMISSELTRRHKLGMYTGILPEDTLWLDCKGCAGQSFAAFAIHGVTFNVEGEANDYIGKGLSGAKLIVRPPKDSKVVPSENVLIGNVALYGATSGEAYFRGLAGERFCVRNSGAWAVVEGVGDHGCEYMTGGRVAVLGRTGRNFAAGMSGGIAFVYDEDGTFASRCNSGMVDIKPLHETSITELRSMLENHYKYTESTLARRLLDTWRVSITKFVRVMPRDYARALQEQKKDSALQEKARVAY
jgi:glutamate synthase domain-containing protein 2/glutamate synthase domain-containing protein 1/glutamate synthase domain-containing protein 3